MPLTTALTKRQLRRVFDLTDGRGKAGVKDRKLTKSEIILRLRADEGLLAELLGLPSVTVSTMEEHREFDAMFKKMDVQKGTRGAITFEEFRAMVDGQASHAQSLPAGTAEAIMALAAFLALLMLWGWWRQRQRENEKPD